MVSIHRSILSRYFNFKAPPKIKLMVTFQVVMFQVVSMVARPKPPPISAAAVDLPAFTALYSKCWAAKPTERWVDDNVRYFLIGNYYLTI